MIITGKGNMDTIITLTKKKDGLLWWKTIFWIFFSPILQKIQHITPAQMSHLSSQIIYFLIMKNIVGIPDLNRGEYI